MAKTTVEDSLAQYESERSKYESEWNEKTAEVTNRVKGKDADIREELKALADEYKTATAPLWEEHLARVLGVEPVVVEVASLNVNEPATTPLTKEEKDAIKAAAKAEAKAAKDRITAASAAFDKAK